MIFNPLRRRTPNYDGNMTPLAGPAQPLPGGGDGGVPKFMPPMAPGVDPSARTATTSSQNFTNSLQTERALGANKAANFANMAPLPASNGASAYGDVGQSVAARNAYVGDQQARADLASGGYFTAQRMAGDANTRANNESGAQVKLAGSQAGLTDQQARLMVPAQSGALTAQADETRALTPGKVAGQQATTQGQVIQNQTNQGLVATAPLAVQAQIARQNAETQAIQQKTPAEVEAIKANAGASRDINAQRGALLDDTQKLLTARLQNMTPATTAPDPVQQMEAQSKAYDLAAKVGKTQYDAQPLSSRMWFGSGKSQEQLTDQAFKNLAPAAPAAAPAAPAQSQAPSVGATRYWQDANTGQNVLHKWDGKQWVRA